MSEKREITKETMFDYFDSIDCSAYLEDKSTKTNGEVLQYLKFPSLWREVMKVDPNATYEVIEFDENGHRVDENTPRDVKVYPFRIEPGNVGFTTYVKITILGVTREQSLPIIDSNNAPILKQGYTIQRKNYNQSVHPLNSMDINTSRVRCLVKCLALNFGLGLKTYEGSSYDAPIIIESQNEPSIEIDETPTQVVAPVTKLSAPVSQPVIEQQKVIEEDPFGDDPDFNLSEALKHVLEKGKTYKGRTLQDLLNDKLGAAKAKGEIVKYFQHGTPNDKKAAKAVLAAAENGELTIQ